MGHGKSENCSDMDASIHAALVSTQASEHVENSATRVGLNLHPRRRSRIRETSRVSQPMFDRPAG
jgi:hypothetical protein